MYNFVNEGGTLRNYRRLYEKYNCSSIIMIPQNKRDKAVRGIVLFVSMSPLQRQVPSLTQQLI